MDNIELTFLRSLSKQFPTIASASTEIINLQSILSLPKGTEHFITDIHGEFYKLENLLSKIEFYPDDTVVFMGVYIDRGKYSKEVVDRVIEFGESHNCVYLIGSHEYAYLHSRKKEDYFEYLFWNYGGDATVESYGNYENIYRLSKRR